MAWSDTAGVRHPRLLPIPRRLLPARPDRTGVHRLNMWCDLPIGPCNSCLHWNSRQWVPLRQNTEAVASRPAAQRLSAVTRRAPSLTFGLTRVRSKPCKQLVHIWRSCPLAGSARWAVPHPEQQSSQQGHVGRCRYPPGSRSVYVDCCATCAYCSRTQASSAAQFKTASHHLPRACQ